MEILYRSDSRSAESERLCYRVLPADRLTPVQAAGNLRLAGHRVCLLESTAGPTSLASYSFCALDPELSLRTDDGGVHVTRPGQKPKTHRAGTLEVLRDLSKELKLPPAPRFGRDGAMELPPFHGGLVGYLGFETASELEPSVPVPEADPLGAPRSRFEAYRTVVGFDHRAQTMTLSTICRGGSKEFAAASERLDALEHDLYENLGGLPSRFECEGLEPSAGPEVFLNQVERLQAAIRAGEIFQAVPSRRRTGRYTGDLFALYRALRLTNSAPHMFFFETDDVALVGSSPERLVEVDGSRLRTVPIAGTRPRGTDSAEDRELEAELRASIKERSEHDMLVDLARNDLGRVARIGTVEVVEHARCLRFPRVQHLVSRVEAELRSDLDGLDALASCFPAGTVSGAPKVRALQLIAELERERRGPYAGAFGYLDPRGGLDMAICIRTFVAAGGQLSLQAGAGIVHASDPAAELAEVEAKLSGPLAAVELLTANAAKVQEVTT